MYSLTSVDKCQYISTKIGSLCTNTQYSNCPHCSLWLCFDHIKEHQQLLQEKLHSIGDCMNEQIIKLESLTIDQCFFKCHQQLDTWRLYMNKFIDDLYKKRSEELDELHKNTDKQCQQFQHKQLNLIKTVLIPKLNELVRQQTVIPSDILELKEQLANIKDEIISFEQTKWVEIKCTNGLDDIVKVLSEKHDSISSKKKKSKHLLDIEDILKKKSIQKYYLQANTARI
ncbi:unnamed protein product, partial [Didymodactylos carnosus]